MCETNKRKKAPEYTLPVRNSRMVKLRNIFVFGVELLKEKELAVTHMIFTQELMHAMLPPNHCRDKISHILAFPYLKA